MTILNSSLCASAPFGIGNLAIPLSGAREAPDALRSILDILKIPACVIDIVGALVGTNAQWRVFAGSCAKDSVHSLDALVHIDDQHKLSAAIQSLTQTSSAELAFCECRLVPVDGPPRWHELTLHALGAEEGSDPLWLCLANDIHRLKKRDEDLTRLAGMQTDMLDVSVDCIKLISLEGDIIHMNRAGCRALGVVEGSSFGMSWLPLLPSDVHTAGEQALAMARAGRFARFPGRSQLPGENPQYWDNMLTPLMDEGTEPRAILCVSREITAEREAQENLQRSEERLSLAASVGGLGIWDYDIKRDQMVCDAQWHVIMGVDISAPIRSLAQFRQLIHPDDAAYATEVSQTAEQLVAQGRDYAIDFRIVHPDGEIRWVRSAACIQTDHDVPVRAVGFVVDITDAHAAELVLQEANRTLADESQALKRQNLEDPLTGIANRRHLDLELAKACAHASAGGIPLCIGMIDIDHFKAFNDLYGHAAGDAALRQVALALHSVVRSMDFVARYGGEEFAFILPGMRTPGALLERFLAAVRELAIAHAGSATGFLTISCGCVRLDGCSELPPHDLLEFGDKALYEAKASGRNRFIVWDHRQSAAKVA